MITKPIIMALVAINLLARAAVQKLQKNNLEKHICHQFGVTVSSVYPVSDNSSDLDKEQNFKGSDLVRFEPEDRIKLKNLHEIKSIVIEFFSNYCPKYNKVKVSKIKIINY